uniref:Anaphase-promoting complex subunit 11 RING-H2 finger domain-containing protein n=1 Tax=Phlebotomus papatasi TaxID=29031 RepID=A0A1B0GMH5_PHLPP
MTTQTTREPPKRAEMDSSNCHQRRQCVGLKNSAICQWSPVFLFTFLFRVKKLEFSPQMAEENDNSCDKFDNDACKPDKMFTLKKWNAVALWSWDVECDTCAICRVQVMGFFRIETRGIGPYLKIYNNGVAVVAFLTNQTLHFGIVVIVTTC